MPDDLLRVGAHRAPARNGRGWIAFGWAAVATLVLIVAGLYALSTLTPGRIHLPFEAQSASPSASATPKAAATAAPKLDPTVPITVLNGTTTQGLATKVGDYLVAQGWTGAGPLGTRANASESTIAKTVVYYKDAADEGAARALVKTLAVGEIRLSTDFNDRITVVLGSDYKPQS
ncbi:LytR C-terminal domain-containing protein [Parafrigoribacterium soli]|uniref:LytR C-terminal domain-containing protein n=1 Tax=Parafrigoribacterium soli TaxID=3144663 RepID=UPI0032EDE3D9